MLSKLYELYSIISFSLVSESISNYIHLLDLNETKEVENTENLTANGKKNY